MRYVIAMAVAVAAALVAMLFLSQPAATWVTNQFTYDSPDSVGDLHAIVYMGLNIAALLAGWLAGWVIGSPFQRERVRR